MALADTSFVIDLLTEEAGATAKLDELIELGEPIWAPAIALHELYYGAYLHAASEREVQRIREIEQALLPVVFSPEAARIAARIEANLEVEGNAPGRADVQIAATAIDRGEALITRDERLASLERLETETY